MRLKSKRNLNKETSSVKHTAKEKGMRRFLFPNAQDNVGINSAEGPRRKDTEQYNHLKYAAFFKVNFTLELRKRMDYCLDQNCFVITIFTIKMQFSLVLKMAILQKETDLDPG